MRLVIGWLPIPNPAFCLLGCRVIGGEFVLHRTIVGLANTAPVVKVESRAPPKIYKSYSSALS
jgi:hypothetical protein